VLSIFYSRRAFAVAREKKEIKSRDLASKTGGGAGVLRVVKFPVHASSTSEADCASTSDAMDVDARSTPRSATGHILADLDTPAGRCVRGCALLFCAAMLMCRP
jgi:hypothetical protein